MMGQVPEMFPLWLDACADDAVINNNIILKFMISCKFYRFY